MSNGNLLRISLQCAVPLWIIQMENWSWERIQCKAKECSEIVAHEGDHILFKSRKPGGSARAFNALAQGIACLSFCPGGVDCFGGHYEARLRLDPDVQRIPDECNVLLRMEAGRLSEQLSGSVLNLEYHTMRDSDDD